MFTFSTGMLQSTHRPRGEWRNFSFHCSGGDDDVHWKECPHLMTEFCQWFQNQKDLTSDNLIMVTEVLTYAVLLQTTFYDYI